MSFSTHPGVVLSELLRDKSISPSAFSKCLNVPEDFLHNILDGTSDIDASLSIVIDGCLGEERPERWVIHQREHNSAKKLQP